MYGGTSTRTYEITIYMELTSKDVYTTGNYYYASTTLLTNLLPNNYMVISSIKYILLNRFNNNGGYTSLSCIIPAGRRFLIQVSTYSGTSSDITFTAMKFGR